MRYFGFSLLIFVILGAAPSPNKDKAKIDRNLLQGAWGFVSLEVDGKLYTPNEIKGYVGVSKQGEIVCDVSEKNARHFSYGVGIDEKLVFLEKKSKLETKVLGGVISAECEYKIDVSKNPKRLTFIGEDDGDKDEELREPLYIYSVTKDELRLCFGIGAYPSSFKTKDNRKTCLIIYKRVKK